MKTFRTLVTLALLMAGTVLSAQNKPGGQYYQLIWSDDGESLLSENDLTLIPHDGTFDFALTVRQADGFVAWVGTDEMDVVRIKDGHIWYAHPNKNYDFELEIIPNPVDADGEVLQDCVRVIEHIGDSGSPYPAETIFSGIYSHIIPTFTDEKGYLYKMKGEYGCELIRGGFYTDKVTLPEKVFNWFGEEVEVYGIAENCFADSYDVTGVTFANDRQYAGPGAYVGTQIPYDYQELPKPYFAYPNAALDTFVVPAGPETSTPESSQQWVVFKQNAALGILVADTHADEDKDLGRADFDFDNNQGFFFTMQDAELVKDIMFRGYDAYEIETLVAPSEYVAHHRFPSFSRWKFPETEREAKSYVIDEVLARYPGHKVMYSRWIASIRQGAGQGEFSMVEFEHQDGRAMVVYVWEDSAGELSMGDLQVDLSEESDEYGVWNVDDEGTYGIPDVVTIALDSQEHVTIFVAKNSPESVERYAWHQVENRLEYEEYGSWYRYYP